MGVKVLKRLIHWGPISSLSIISFVTTATIYCSNMWCPINSFTFGSIANISVFVLFAYLAIYNFICAVCIGPGYLPLHWHPATKRDQQYVQYCELCNGYKAPRSHHCRKCGRCVLKMDHHCPWINNCVGHKNHKHFTCFLIVAVCGSIQSLCLLIITVVKFFNANTRYHYYSKEFTPPVRLTIFSLASCLFCIGVSFGVILSLSMLLYFQIKSIVRNKTGIEYWILEKSEERRQIDPTISPFVYPYDLGCFRNIRQVFDSSKAGDGINWPVIDGCSQYDLTVEQIQQKILKRLRRRPYKVLYKYNGSYCPATHGVCTLFHPPCTTENRMSLNPDELVLVTRYHRYWLFGEKCASHVKMKCKGWFPKSCVVPVTDYRYFDSENKKDF